MYWGGRSKGVAVATGTIQNVMRRSRAHSALRVEHWRNGHGRPWRKQRQGQKRKTKKGSAESEREEEGEGREKEEQIGGSRPSCWCSRKRLYGIAATCVLWYQDCPTRKSIQTPSITHQRFQRGGARRPATDSSGRWCMNRRRVAPDSPFRGPGSGADCERLWPAKLRHPVQDVACD